ncbi:MAG TPA: tetratricopeptide repeat protein, partial [Vicinamibacteria bacterium]|nr:tetratricopeptide repeat protein [Vicinamibacteria bacterium]
IEQSLKALETDPRFAPAHEDLGRAYVQKGMYRQAIAAFRKAVVISRRRSARYIAGLGHACAVAGKRSEALGFLKELKRLGGTRYVSSHAFALLFAGLGDREQALSFLAKARRERSSAIPFVAVEPRFALLHSDPRFRRLFRRGGPKAHRTHGKDR